MEERISVAAKGDFLARQTKGKPVPSLAELIWNSLDADATEVRVEFENNDLAGGMSKIAVYDDGEAFSRERASELFGNLGGSWKSAIRQTTSHKRMIHGQEGRGRYKAFALGNSVTWKVCHRGLGGCSSFEVRLLEADLANVMITTAVPQTTRKHGVVVEIVDLKRSFEIFQKPEGLQELNEIFALYLLNYKAVSIAVGGHFLRPEEVIASRGNLQLDPICGEDGSAHAVELEIIEWQSDTRRTVYMCSAEGFPYDQLDARFRVPGFCFSAYIKSSYVEQFYKEKGVALAELDPRLTKAVDQARAAIKTYFRDRAAQKARSIVEEWIDQKIYPYTGEPKDAVERVERQVFDIVAVQIQEFSPDLGQGSIRAKALHLRMLRHALENGPNELQLILKEVLELTAEKQKELASLLQETTLSALITAGKVVADRLKFLSALETIVFDPDTKSRLKERSQLHKILAENTWVFGEEYNLWVSDKDLRRVLEKHRDNLDPSISIDEPVKVIDQKRGIVDLMFSRATRRHRADDIEHMVVELKAPKVKIGSSEVIQAKKYAIAVTSDERFATVEGVRWHFWLVSNSYDEYARYEIESGPDRDRRLIAKGPRHTVGIKTWGELIEENRARLQFFQEHLQHSADEGMAVQYLQDRHSEYLEGVIVSDEGEDPLGSGGANGSERETEQA